MIKGTTPPFEIPNEMRAVAERSVEQAKLAFNNYMQAAQEAVSTFEERVKASQVGAQGISKKAMSFAEREANELRRFLGGNPLGQKIEAVEGIASVGVAWSDGVPRWK